MRHTKMRPDRGCPALRRGRRSAATVTLLASECPDASVLPESVQERTPFANDQHAVLAADPLL